MNNSTNILNAEGKKQILFFNDAQCTQCRQCICTQKSEDRRTSELGDLVGDIEYEGSLFSRNLNQIDASSKMSPMLSIIRHEKSSNTISVDDLFDPSFNFISNERVIFQRNDLKSLENFSKFSTTVKDCRRNLEIKNIQDLEKLSQPCLDIVNKEFIDTITILFKIDKHTVDAITVFLSIISENSTFFPNLTTLILGDIRHNITLKLPDGLTELKIGDIWNNSNLNLVGSFDAVTNFIIGEIGCYSTLNLPDLLPSLRNLTLGNLGDDSTCKLPSQIPNLTSLTLGNIAPNINLILPLALDKVEILIIGSIYSNAIFTISNLFSNLKKLTIGNVEEKATLNLDFSLNYLETLTIGHIERNINFQLPDSLNQLIHLSIGYIFRDAIFILPTSLEALEDISIENLNTTLELPSSLDNNLKKISIESIDYKGVLNLPKSLNKLKEFYLGTVAAGAMIRMPDSMEGLERLITESVEDQSLMNYCR